ncbi:MAG: bifunctional 4-hydroxy-3-methylbut-2-enyl diphosphate reductase/30S ribosomal protein S1 [Firmicutes bacterium]|nr:bifunctional 4-hydroxy-3-methylbut-2-enyl diphosphate reductase/30S ribosomal protein S1 [Bacillota bacterium]
MEIIRARSAGFCFGVRRALRLAEQALGKYGRICSLGPLIHNSHVVDSLKQKGVEVINDLAGAAGRPVLIRSHGAVPEVFRKAQEEGIVLIDATCPFVRRVQACAEELAQQGYQVVIVGEADHPEVQGIVGWAGAGVAVVRDVEEARNLKGYEKIGILAQTTLNPERFYAIAREFIGKAREVRIHDTICKASLARQREAAEIAKKVKAMVVIGGRNSANTCQLAEICRAYVPTYHIEDERELDLSLLQKAGLVGVTAGASTPDWIIEEVIERMTIFDGETGKALGEEVQVGPQEVTPETGEAGAPESNRQAENLSERQDSPDSGPEEMMDLDLAGTPRQIQQGDLISGTVVQVRDDEVLLDIGGKSEGIIPRQELSLKNIGHPQEIVKVGDVLDVYVLRVDNDEGHLILSKKRADRMKALDFLEQALQEKTELAGEVVKVVKGGLLVDVLGIRGFVPASLVERGYVADLEKYLGKTLRLRVIEFDRNRGKVVLSQKAILQEEHLKAQKELWETIQPGEIRKGTVRHLTNFGAFVDLGGVDGLLHISEMSWGRVNHPSEVVQEGNEIEVYVLSVDKENKRISLSLKQVLPNPWDTVDERYQVGQIVTGTIVRLVSFGAFVEIEPGVEGLVHISRLADRRVGKPEDVVAVGQEVKVKILDINKQDQRIGLSIRDARVNHEKVEKNPASSGSEVCLNLGDVFGELFSRAEQKVE